MTDEQFDREYAELLARFDRRIWWEAVRRTKVFPGLSTHSEDLAQHIRMQLWAKRASFSRRPEGMHEQAFVVKVARQAAYEFVFRLQCHRLVRTPPRKMQEDEFLRLEPHEPLDLIDEPEDVRRGSLSDEVKEKVGRLLQYVREDERDLLLVLVGAGATVARELYGNGRSESWARGRRKTLLANIKKQCLKEEEEACHHTSLSKSPR